MLMAAIRVVHDGVVTAVTGGAGRSSGNGLVSLCVCEPLQPPTTLTTLQLFQSLKMTHQQGVCILFPHTCTITMSSKGVCPGAPADQGSHERSCCC